MATEENRAAGANRPASARARTSAGKRAPRTPAARESSRHGTPRAMGGRTPSFMRPTAASSAKSSAERAPRQARDARLRFERGEGADSFTPVEDFLKDARGATPMKKGKHGRFSTVGSYFMQPRGVHVDACGLGHEEGSAFLKDVGKGVATSTAARFGKDSFLRACFDEHGYQGGPMLGHTQLVDPEDRSGTSAFKSGTPLDRGAFLREGTFLRDKDLAECAGQLQLSRANASSFRADTEFDSGQSAAFRDTTQRFTEKELDPGLCSLGPETPLFDPPPKSAVTYVRPKHSRSSDVGSIWAPAKGGPQKPPKRL